MLYVGCTTAYSATAPTSTTGDCWCPYCGSWPYPQGIYVRHEFDIALFKDDEPLLIAARREAWPRPQNDRIPQRLFTIARHVAPRPGRELRHRGGFRNFHKMRA